MCVCVQQRGRRCVCVCVCVCVWVCSLYHHAHILSHSRTFLNHKRKETQLSKAIQVINSVLRNFHCITFASNDVAKYSLGYSTLGSWEHPWKPNLTATTPYQTQETREQSLSNSVLWLLKTIIVHKITLCTLSLPTLSLSFSLSLCFIGVSLMCFIIITVYDPWH